MKTAEMTVMNTLRILIAVLAFLFAFCTGHSLRAFALQQQKEVTVYMTNTKKRFTGPDADISGIAAVR
jgi:hypothetical protein